MKTIHHIKSWLNTLCLQTLKIVLPTCITLHIYKLSCLFRSSMDFTITEVTRDVMLCRPKEGTLRRKWSILLRKKDLAVQITCTFQHKKEVKLEKCVRVFHALSRPSTHTWFVFDLKTFPCLWTWHNIVVNIVNICVPHMWWALAGYKWRWNTSLISVVVNWMYTCGYE